MSSQTKFKKDKEIIAEYEAQIKGETRAGESCLPSPFLISLLWPFPPSFPPCHHEMLLCINNLIVRRNSGSRTSPDWFLRQRVLVLGVWIIGGQRSLHCRCARRLLPQLEECLGYSIILAVTCHCKGILTVIASTAPAPPMLKIP